MEQQRPLISCTQKIVIYETKARYFVVGSNNTETKFRVLKIDRMEPKELIVTDDKVEYTRKEIRELLLMIDMGNRPQLLQKGPIGLKRTVSAFGIVGFVRFLEGYYIVLITKRRRVALIGGHTIYKIEDTTMVYIPNDLVRYTHSDEQRYVKTFQNVDLSSNFYFSYSYDLTHTLQYNLQPCKLPSSMTSSDYDSNNANTSHSEFWQTDKVEDRLLHNSVKADADIEDASNSVQNYLDIDETSSAMETKEDKELTEEKSERTNPTDTPAEKSTIYGIRTTAHSKFMWNEFLLRKVCDELQSDWPLYIVHGFIGQSNISVFGRCIYLTLIARRSNQYAGTRFLKRGANAEGFVANEVETEQIVHDASLTSFNRSRFTSFVQLRGSIPLHWSQDISKMVPKPPINLDQADPYGHISGQHFNQVLRRYGSPIIVLDLVKKRENKRHESVISDELVAAIQYLNQFLPTEHAIKYVGFDMARVSKTKDSNVLMRLAEIAEYCVKKTGFFQSRAGYYCREIRSHSRWSGVLAQSSDASHRQHGVVRTNCVDCLDRTNTAQFAIGKCALALQLHALGIIDQPQLDFDSDCVRMMEDLYEDQGDTLALQYGGSQLVHRIKGYRKVAPWTSSSRDIMQTLSRYYSNAFSDADKQHAINLFLGIFEPKEGQPNLWELTTDFYLHHAVNQHGAKARLRRYSQWWESPVVSSLPYAYEQESKGQEGRLVVVKAHEGDERIDAFWEYYKPYELSTLDEQYSFNMPNSIRDFMPKFATNCSPISPRVWPGRRRRDDGNANAPEANPNVSGKDSTSSILSNGSEESMSDSEGSELEGNLELDEDSRQVSDNTSHQLISLKDLFPTMMKTYGVEIKNPNRANAAIYKKYVSIGDNATPVPMAADSKLSSATVIAMNENQTKLVQTSMFTMDCSYSVEPPCVPSRSRDIYAQYVSRGKHGAGPPTKNDLKVYPHYAASSKVLS